jgi:hypothetical protein
MMRVLLAAICACAVSIGTAHADQLSRDLDSSRIEFELGLRESGKQHDNALAQCIDEASKAYSRHEAYDVTTAIYNACSKQAMDDEVERNAEILTRANGQVEDAYEHARARDNGH